jgi:hypothetical protein
MSDCDDRVLGCGVLRRRASGVGVARMSFNSAQVNSLFRSEPERL